VTVADNWRARVHVADHEGPIGTLELGLDWHWKGPDLLAAYAEALTVGYRYSPADGIPGGTPAQAVARALGGQVELPPQPVPEPNTVY
jgi:hypothetical protein